MSGHSHAKTVKRVKDAAAAQRSKIFSKLANELTIAAREGADPATNAQLRSVIEKARKANMPSDNIERAVKRGSGGEEGANLQEFLVDAYGPAGVPLLIQGIADNKNRALGEIKQAVEKHGGKLVEEGAVRWMFERKGVLVLTPGSKEETELALIEAGAEDFSWDGDVVEAYADPARIADVRGKLREAGLEVESSGLVWVAKDPQPFPETADKLETLMNALDELAAVQNVYAAAA